MPSMPRRRASGTLRGIVARCESNPSMQNCRLNLSKTTVRLPASRLPPRLRSERCVHHAMENADKCMGDAQCHAPAQRSGIVGPTSAVMRRLANACFLPRRGRASQYLSRPTASLAQKQVSQSLKTLRFLYACSRLAVF